MWYINTKDFRAKVYAKEGFILTMWYINVRIVDKWMQDRVCFILTMWYINNMSDENFSNNASGFYINYVVYK